MAATARSFAGIRLPRRSSAQRAPPDLGDLGSEVDHGRQRQDRIDLGAPLRSAPRIPGETHAREQLGDYDGRERYLLLGQRGENVGEG